MNTTSAQANTTSTQAVGKPWWLRILVGRRPALTLVRVAIWVAAAFFIFRVVLLPVRVDGVSMMPTYKNGGVNFINRWAYARHHPLRGDVVSIRFAGPHVMLLKRIIALPGERVAIHKGIVYIDGEPLDEPYVKLFNPTWEEAEVTLKPDEYFIIGDNRSMRSDEHTHGRVEAYRIVGKVLL
jgi:signal peptidase I